MSAYPGAENEGQVSYETLAATVAALIEACGMGEADARQFADALTTANRPGVHSHGTMRVPDYVGKFTRAGVDAKGRPCVVRAAGAPPIVDAGDAMGQVAFAIDRAMDRPLNVPG